MSINIIGKRFEAPPSAEEILALLRDGQAGDINQAKQALTEILAPMKDLLSLFAFTEDLADVANRQAALLKEQEQAEADLETTKVELEGFKEALKIQEAKVGQAHQDLAAHERAIKTLSQEIETENSKRLMLDQTVKTEYERLRGEMLGRLKLEEELARSDLKALKAEIAAAETKLAQVKQVMADLAKGLTN